MERIGNWTKNVSRSSSKVYWNNASTKQSVWADESLPHGWAWAKDREDSPRYYVNLYTGARSDSAPTEPAGLPPHHAGAAATAAGPAAAVATTQLSFQASQTAGDDLASTPYIPDPAVRGMNIPDNIRSKRDYLLGHGIPEEDRWKLQVDEVALYSITEGRQAEKMTGYIVDAMRTIQTRAATFDSSSSNSGSAEFPRPFTITDATAAVGGNTLSFARHPAVERVHSIELSPQRARMCAHNAEVARVAPKVRVHCGDAISTVDHATWPNHVVFMDPPWGGPQYAQAAYLDMFLGSTDVADWSVMLTGGDIRLPRGTVRSLLVAIKAPLNYNTQGLKVRLAAAGTGAAVHEVYPMHKMQLILIFAAPGSVLYSPGAAAMAGAGAATTASSSTGASAGAGAAGHAHLSLTAGVSAAGTKRPREAMEQGAGPASPSAESHAKGRRVEGEGEGEGQVHGHGHGQGKEWLAVGFELMVPGAAGEHKDALQPSGLFLSVQPSPSPSLCLVREPHHLQLAHVGGHAHGQRQRQGEGEGEGQGHQDGFTIAAYGPHVFSCHVHQGSVTLSPVSGGSLIVSGHAAAGAAVTVVTEAAGAGMAGAGQWNAHGGSAVWRIHTAFDAEAVLTRSPGPTPCTAAVLRSLCLPVLSDVSVAGEGKRGRVLRGTAHGTAGHRKWVLKVQPWDDRVAQETSLVSALTASIQSRPADAHHSVLSILCLPSLVVRDMGPWIGVGQHTARCIQFMQDAGVAIDDRLPLAAALPAPIVFITLRRLLTGLAALHEAGYLHADVHAGNVLVPDMHEGGIAGSSIERITGCSAEQATHARLIDFGSLRPLQPAGPGGAYRGPTRGGRWDSMPPEQFGQGKWGTGDVTLTPASDVYAAAATAVHLLLGRRPFVPGETGLKGSAPAGTKLTVEGCVHAPLRTPERLQAVLAPLLAASEDGFFSDHAASSLLGALVAMLHPDPHKRPRTGKEALDMLAL